MAREFNAIYLSNHMLLDIGTSVCALFSPKAQGPTAGKDHLRTGFSSPYLDSSVVEV